MGNSGWDSTVTAGRVFRSNTDLNFSNTSGLGQTDSDWLLAGQLRTQAGFSFDGRVFF
jgi:LPS-assembly protein